jgi:hypothetical protein
VPTATTSHALERGACPYGVRARQSTDSVSPPADPASPHWDPAISGERPLAMAEKKEQGERNGRKERVRRGGKGRWRASALIAARRTSGRQLRRWRGKRRWEVGARTGMGEPLVSPGTVTNLGFRCRGAEHLLLLDTRKTSFIAKNFRGEWKRAPLLCNQGYEHLLLPLNTHL